MNPLLSQLLGRANDPDTVCECRDCGTSVACTRTTCPACNREEISRFDL